MNSSFLIQWIVVHGRSSLMESLLWLIPFLCVDLSQLVEFSQHVSVAQDQCIAPNLFPPFKNVICGYMSAALVNAFMTSASSSHKATDDLITTLTRLAISHDRQLQTLEGRHTIIILIYGQEETAKVKNIRDEWQKQKPEKGSAHPSGASQRSVVWAQLMNILQGQCRELITKAPTYGILAVRHGEPSVKPGASGYDISLEVLQQCVEAIDRLASIPIPEVEKMVF